MVKNWWKIAAMLLVTYATFFSFYNPLEPALFGTDQNELTVGINEVTLTGYNTHFKEHENSNYIFLKSSKEDYAICVADISVIDDTHLSFQVDVPSTLPSKVLEVHMSNNHDGPMFLPSAFNVSNSTVGASSSPCPMTYAKGNDTMFQFPYRVPSLYETIRNLNFHVPMWFTMFVLMGISLWHSIRYLNSEESVFDIKAASAAKLALVFCALGLLTGSIWARFTWGDWWTNDPKLNGAGVSFLLLSAYFILRKSAADKPNSGKIAAVYNIISFFMIMSLIMVLPRLMESLHPGQSGNPAFGAYDLDDKLRMVFYPACAGWILTGIWMYTLHYRIAQLKNKSTS